MAYRRKYYKKRTYKKAKTKDIVNNKTITVWSDHSVLEKANKALQLASKVYRFVNTETKHHDLNSNTTVSSTGSIISLASIAQGDTESTRDGTSIKPLSLKLKMQLNDNPSGAVTQTVRLIIFRVKLDNQVAPTVTSYLDNASIQSFKNYDNRFQFETLYDKRHQTITGDRERTYWDINLKLHKHIQYGTGTNNYESGGLYMLAISQSATAGPTLLWQTRMTYVDN